MRKVSKADRLFYFERNFFTLDGLWMIETESETDWETALRIDLEVWKKLLKIIIRRITNYLEIKTKTVKDIVEILTFRWSVEKWEYEVLTCKDDIAEIKITKCPYKAIMDRNPERQDRIPLICKEMCIPFYETVVKDFNPQIELNRSKYMGLGNQICDFKLRENHES